MAAEKSPAFQFYPRDYLADIHVLAMSNAERGMYMTLLCLCWLEQSISPDLAELARLVGCGQQRFSKSWNCRLSRCFIVGNDGRLFHKRLNAERDKQHAFHDLQAAHGRLGGLARQAALKHARVLSSSSSTAVYKKGVNRHD